MLQKLILGGLVGGIILFVWGAVSWMVLPWHRPTFHKFTQEEVVKVVLAANAPQRGIYLVPFPHGAKSGEGPFAFVAVRPHGGASMPRHLLISLLTQILGAAFVTALLLQKGKMSYREKAAFVTLFAFAAGVVSHLPYWNWWSFSSPFTVVALADLVTGWFLAGLALAKIV